MRFDNPFGLADLRRAEAIPDTPGLVVQASFHGVRAVVTFGQQFINPVFGGQLALNEREDVLVTLYRRIFAFAASLAVLGLPVDAQAIASLARSVFEVFVDLKAINLDAYPDGPQRFRAFTSAERLRIARKTVDFENRNPGILLRRPDAERQFIAVDAARIEAEARGLWGLASPPHWSGERSLQTRARAVGLEHVYIAFYPQLSGYVHGGAAGFHGIGLEGFAALVSICHMLAVKRVAESLEILAAELRLSAAIEGLADKLRFLESVQGLLLADLKLMAAGEPQRLFLEMDWSDERRGRASHGA